MEGLIQWKESAKLMLMWLILGLAGGLIHICEEEEHLTLKRKMVSLIISCLTGMTGGMVLSSVIKDPMVLGGICSMMGYGGILVLRAALKAVMKKLTKVIGD